MCYFEKVLLYSYPHLTNIIGDMDKLVCQKAYCSFSNNVSCLDLSEKIIRIIDKKDRLIDLKLKLDEIFKNFSVEEMLLLEQKFFKRKAVLKKLIEKFTIKYSLRTYFRKQNRLLEKFSKSLNKNGMNEKWFLDKYGDIDWFKCLYSRLKYDEKIKQKKLKEGYLKTA
jgi:hypothetical protein